MYLNVPNVLNEDSPKELAVGAIENNPCPEIIKFVVVTADGLPYKIIIDLVKNTHPCAVCGQRLSDMTEHMQKTQHAEFFKTYGNNLPNIGQFHFALTMLRSLLKLEWNIDYQ